MRLNYIEIQGFKSFPDRTRVTFEQGFTAIVGPNGSGKSNISDAVRWVLGEQSSKSLRGGKMEDVVFGGTQLRKPMGYAQVSLCLEDAKDRFPATEGQVVVSRRFYRSGDSEYLVNGATVRLRDVREMFLDTGLGRDGYSIIGQGRISEIVSAKGTERREIFEEASGIAKYRFRKNEASRKLEAAEDNLARLRDILDELTARLGPLEKQREQALRFLELSDEKKSLEITLYCDTIERSRESLRSQDDKIEISRRDYENVEREIIEVNEQTERFHELNRERNVAIERYNTDIEQKNAEIARVESDAAVRRNDVAHAEEQIAALRATLESMSASGGGIEREIEARRLTIEQRRAETAALDELIAEAEKELASLARTSEAAQSSRAETAKKLDELREETTNLRVETTAAQASLELLARRSDDVNLRLADSRERLADASKEKGENDEFLSGVLSEITECENLIRGYDIKISSRKERLTQLTSELDKKRAQINDFKNKASLLRDMERSMEGFSASVKRVSEAARSRELRGVVGTVASLIEVNDGYELAIETALGAAAQNVVVEDERAAKQAIAYLKESKVGRATFLPLDTIKPSRFDDAGKLSESGIIGLASSLVSAEAKYDSIVSNLLGRIIVAEDLDSASTLARKLNYRYKIVTTDGQVINAGGSYTGGFSARSAGLFSRKAEIDRLEAKAAETEQSCESALAEKDKLERETQALEAQSEAARADLSNRGEDRVRVATRLAQLESEIRAFETAVGAAEDELKGIEINTTENEQTKARAEGRLSALAAEVERLEAASGDEQTGDLDRRRAELSGAMSERRIERVEKLKDIESVEFAIEQLERQRADAEGRFGDIGSEIMRLEETIKAHEEYIALRLALADELRAGVEKSRGDITSSVAEREGNEREITLASARYDELVRKREEIARETSRLEERKVALQTEYDSANAKLWEDYELTRAEARALCVPFESITELRSSVQSLRARIRSLGNVNVGAIEEYKDVFERSEFLGAQLADVESSKEELLKLIASLEVEMTEIFTEKFSAINASFRRIFVELFGGGSANLYLADESDVLGSGIEMDVQPSGKVINNLALLSGGEQALVAIAIYFAILSVNPSPFCILDEIDSALDESNVGRFANYLKRVTDRTQIIAITHRRGTMESADVLYGVTMQEEGVSKLLRLDVEEARLVINN